MKTNILRKPFKYSFQNAALILIAINIGVFVLTQIQPRIATYLSLNVILVTQGNMYWQFFTYMFVHADMYHLIGNMLGLIFFGTAVERAVGSKEFVFMYLLIGVLCGIVSFALYYFSGLHGVFLLGASGAVYGILLIYAVLHPQATIYIWGILPVPAPLLVIIYAGISLWSQFSNSSSGIAHMAHLAGFVFAWLYLLFRMGVNPWKIWKNTFR